jgi:hypothetical protein
MTPRKQMHKMPNARAERLMSSDFGFHGALRILDFWGKAGPSKQAEVSAYSIAYHSMDVSAVGSELIARDGDRPARIATATALGRSLHSIRLF